MVLSWQNFWNVFLHRSVLVEQGYLRTWFRWARGIKSSLYYFRYSVEHSPAYYHIVKL